MLRYTPDELQKKLLNERSFQEQFQKEIGRSLERLSLAMAERNADVPLTWDSVKGRWMKPPRILLFAWCTSIPEKLWYGPAVR